MDEGNRAEVMEALEALKAASKDIEANSDESGCNSPSMKALLELETGSFDLFSGDPKLSALSSLLSRLKSLASSLKSGNTGRTGGGGGLRSLIRRRSGGGSEISRVAGSIGSELQSWIDRQSIDRLISSSTSDEEKSALLIALESRLSQGFDTNLQDLLLRSGVFSAVESLLSDPSSSKGVRERAATAILAFVRFNKNVFVGEVLMGPTVRSLFWMSSATSLRVLNGLIASIRSPLIDQLHADGHISKIVALLSPSNDDDEVKIAAFDTVLEIGCFGRKEAIDDMLEQGLIEELVELQRSELGGSNSAAEIEEGVRVGGVIRSKRGEEERRFLEAHPFASCVARFAIQLEVGEGLRQREKRSIKLEVLRRAREAAISAAEAATIVAEVLWGPVSW